MASDKIAIERELFERLADATAELNCDWILAGDQRSDLTELAAKAVAIRDAPPQGMTDGEREAWTEAGKYESQLQAAAQRLQATLGKTEAVDVMGVVEAVDELIARHAEAIDEWKRINLPASASSE